MARWRVVKKGKIKSLDTKKQSDDSICYCDASLGQRAKAFITDMFMLLMPILYLVFYVVMGSREEFANDKMHGWLYILIPNMLIVVTFWYFKMQTPGMKAYDIRIVDTNTGEKPLLLWLINRYLLTLVAILFPIFLFIPFFNKKKKTFQDYLSGTCIQSYITQ